MNKEEVLTEKQLPHNFLAEKMVLSCLLINVEALELTIKNLPIEAFYFKNHQEIYKIIIFMYNDKRSIDILSLSTMLQEYGLLEKIGGIKVLLELINQVPNLIYIEEYIRLIKEKYVRRSLITLGYKMVNSGYVTNISLETLIKNLENELFDLTNENKSQKIRE